MHNLLRGSGPAGLASMRAFRSFTEDLVMVRPLLSLTRADILKFLSSRHQTYRVDSSNTNTDYARNFLRNTLMPLLADRYGDQVSRRLTDCSERIEESLVAFESLGKRLIDEATFAGRTSPPLAIPTAATAITLDVSALRHAPWPVTREGLRQLWLEQKWPLQSMTRDHWLNLQSWISLANFIQDEWQTVGTLPGAVVVRRSKRCLLLHRDAG
ncbi:MAG: ATP-binding protein [Pirellulales bacterium]